MDIACYTPILDHHSQENLVVDFLLTHKEIPASITIVAGPFYEVIADGWVISYGPTRAPNGFARPRKIMIPGNSKYVLIRLVSYGIPSYDCDYTEPYIGLTMGDGLGTTIGTLADFDFFIEPNYVTRSSKFSFQRGFIERYDFTRNDVERIKLRKITGPTLLKPVRDPCRYNVLEAVSGPRHPFKGFDEASLPGFMENPRIKPRDHFDVKKEFLDVVSEGYDAIEFEYPHEVAGIMRIDIDSEEDGTDAFVVFDEIKPEGKWIFPRLQCNSFVTIKLAKGHNSLYLATPNSYKNILILTKAKATFKVSTTLLQNDSVADVTVPRDKDLAIIKEAAIRTFAQNAFDIFTDCPSRERAGWLCDSFFEGRAERYLTGKSDVERPFLENFIVGSCPEIPDGMIPMCYPSEHEDHTYIPNWAMWFVLELAEYRERSGDDELIEAAKDKVLRLLEFLEKYENEFGLLENLESWVFIEWSKAADFAKGVSFPTNMLYAATLEAASKMYGLPELQKKAAKARASIQPLSYFDGLYHDHAVRDGSGALKTSEEDVSETCQYYALFFGFEGEPGYKERILSEYGPSEPKEGTIAPSAPFIGFLLRLDTLRREGKKEELLKEIKSYYLGMAKATGTLWETASTGASCNHGFASYIACLIGDGK